MDKISSLLRKLDNNVSSSILKRVDGLKNLYNRLDVAKKDLSDNPDDEDLKNSLSEITDYINDYEDDLIEDLEILLQAKQEEYQRVRRAESERQKRAEFQRQKRAESERQKQEEAEKQKKSDEEKEKKSSGGVTALIVGGILLVASVGAINIFKNNR